MTSSPQLVGFFATCLVDLFRPCVGFSALRLLEQAGYAVDVPPRQICCGQPAYNSGDFSHARAMACDHIRMFSQYAYVVVPSGSCAGMIRRHYPSLLEDQPEWHAKARELAAKTYELTSFLSDICGGGAINNSCQAKIAYHDSCSCLRELSIYAQPRKLLKKIANCQLVEFDEQQKCCGFGGTFCIKYSDISTRMVSDKVAALTKSGAELVLSADLGCLLNIAGRCKRLNSQLELRHIAEFLAGDFKTPPIGEK